MKHSSKKKSSGTYDRDIFVADIYFDDDDLTLYFLCEQIYRFVAVCVTKTCLVAQRR